MQIPFIPDQKQLKSCLQEIKKNIKQTEEKKAESDQLIGITAHWDYGPNPYKKRQQNNKQLTNSIPLGPRTIYPRLDSTTFKNQLRHIISTYDHNDEIYKTSLHLSRVINNIDFCLLNGNILPTFTYTTCIAQFNLSQAIGPNWGLITDRLYGCQFCVYYNGFKYSSWIKLIDRKALAEAFGCTREYRMSYAPAIETNVGNIGLTMVLSGAEQIGFNRAGKLTKHVGYGYCNLIKKKRKRKVEIDGHSMIHILQENKHEVYVTFYTVNGSAINAKYITVTLESNATNNIKPAVLFQTLPPDLTLPSLDLPAAPLDLPAAPLDLSELSDDTSTLGYGSWDTQSVFSNYGAIRGTNIDWCQRYNPMNRAMSMSMSTNTFDSYLNN